MVYVTAFKDDEVHLFKFDDIDFLTLKETLIQNGYLRIMYWADDPKKDPLAKEYFALKFKGKKGKKGSIIRKEVACLNQS